MGIGLAVSRALAGRGAHVVIAARGHDAIDAALRELSGDGHARLQLDVSDTAAWELAVDELFAGGPLHGLVAAAAVLGPVGPLDEVCTQGVLDGIAVNLVGTVLAMHYLLPALRAAGGRAVTFSGGGATSPLPRYDTYAVSKAGVVRLTENVAAAGAIEVNCVAPGFVATRIHDGTLRAGPDAAGGDYYRWTETQLRKGGFPGSEAAELVCFLLSDEARGISGKLLSAEWDPWRDERFRARLRTDASLATLRRIDGQCFGAVTRS